MREAQQWCRVWWVELYSPLDQEIPHCQSHQLDPVEHQAPLWALDIQCRLSDIWESFPHTHRIAWTLLYVPSEEQISMMWMFPAKDAWRATQYLSVFWVVWLTYNIRQHSFQDIKRFKNTQNSTNIAWCILFCVSWASSGQNSLNRLVRMCWKSHPGKERLWYPELHNLKQPAAVWSLNQNKIAAHMLRPLAYC